jgi:preprotein translocase subunit SecD
MDRGWYARFGLIVGCLVVSCLALWPSIPEGGSFPGAPDWVRSAFRNRIAPGLDIQGGMRLMYEVEVDEAVVERRDLRAQQIFERLCFAFEICNEDEAATDAQLDETRERVRVETVRDNAQAFRVVFENEADIATLDRDMVNGFDLREAGTAGNVVTLELRDDAVERLRETSVEQARETIANRIDELGLREASVMARDTNIVVELPGAGEDTFEEIREIIARTARLEFLVVDDESQYVEGLSGLPEGIERTSERVRAGEDNPEVTSSYLVASGDFVVLAPSEAGADGAAVEGDVVRGTATRIERDESGIHLVEFRPTEGEPVVYHEGEVTEVYDARGWLQRYIDSLDESGSMPEERQLVVGMADTGEFEEEAADTVHTSTWRTYTLHRRTEVTGDAIEDAAVAFDQQDGSPYVSLTFNSAGARAFDTLTGDNVMRRMAIVLDNRVESAPMINQRIGGGRAQITLGGFRPVPELLEEANQLVVVLRAGALPAPITPSNEQLIGPTLGRDSVNQGMLGGLMGIIFVLLFMGLYYEVGGLVANTMVVINVLFLLAVLAALGGTLTLPGIAGVTLTVGMAVDANVLINERIREELRLGKTPRTAVELGFDRAFWSIFDSQLTTFIAGVVLFQYGTGPIRGFAVTLIIGIITSLFTGVFCSKVMFDWIVRGLKVRKLRVG